MVKGFCFICCHIVLQAGEGGLEYSFGRDLSLGREIQQFFYKKYCAYPGESCLRCFKKNSCSYALVFAPAAVFGSLPARLAGRIPYHFVLLAPRGSKSVYRPQEEISIALQLFGKGIASLSYFLEGLEMMGKEGIGRGQRGFSVKKVWLEHPFKKRCYPLFTDGIAVTPGAIVLGDQVERWAKKQGTVHALRLHFLKPAAIRYQDGYLQEPVFSVILKELLARLSLLYYHYHGRDEIDLHHQHLIGRGEKVELLKKETRFVPVRDHPGSHENRKVGGLIGKAYYRGDLTPFLPILKLGEYINLGEESHLGMGRFRLLFPRVFPLEEKSGLPSRREKEE